MNRSNGRQASILARFVVGAAVRALPRAHRGRFHAEWRAELEEYVREGVAVLPAALRILIGVRQMRRDLRGTIRPAPKINRDAAREHGGSDVFWEQLNATEQRALRSVAVERMFGPDERLCTEGQLAEHVFVIRSGVVKVFLEQGGRQRVLAVRGPGELVGERAALQVSSRSASMAALDTVQTLLISTADFAAFIRRHPAVLTVIEQQVYGRLTEVPGMLAAQ